MDQKRIAQKVTDCLCEEFQAVWIVKIEDLSMTAFRLNLKGMLSDKVDIINKLNAYEEARQWYVKTFAVPRDRKNLDEQTRTENVLERIKDGKIYYVEYSRQSAGIVNYNQLLYKGIEDDKGELEYFILGFRDIDVRKNAERDNLTGLYTRRTFFAKAEKMLEEHPDEKFDLMMSDIVDFKVINETYGASVGDEILRWTGEYLMSKMTDDLVVGRYGGDQFVILCAHEIMENICETKSMNAFIEAERQNNLPRITVKYGIYENVDRSQTVIALCDKAHMALNSIKHHYGKTIEYYTEKLKTELEINHKIESSMHQALEQEQFKVFYQPKHSAVTGELVGAEALIRWVHPEYGFMSPAEFIPLFETNGFIAETDYYVWKRTCSNLKKWKDKNIDVVPISVNASKLTFNQPNLIHYLQSIVADNNITPDLLHIEITETLMESNIESLIRKLTAIRAIGYQVELDDFGSGYSSINILSTLPMDIVKLDMSFMKQFGDPKRAKVLAACIRLAKELGYKTISEGVEYPEQHELLGILGVDAIQGYYYSKPLFEPEFEEYLIKHSKNSQSA